MLLSPQGYAILSINNYVHYAAVDANGNFSTTYYSCLSITGTVQILAVDQTTMQQSTLASYTLATPLTDVGNIIICGGVSAQQYINYTFDGVNYSITSANPQDTLTANTSSQGTTNFFTNLFGRNVQLGNYCYFQFQNPTASVGTYNITSIRVQNYSQNLTIMTPSTVTLTNYPAIVGDFYQGTFVSNFKDSLQVLHNVSGDFKVRKNF
jgi:hypothetical protein